MPNKSSVEMLTISVRVPKPIMDRVREQLRDDFLDKPRYGEISNLISRLLAGWLENKPAPQYDDIPDLGKGR